MYKEWSKIMDTFYSSLKNKLKRTIDKHFDKHGYDQAYFDIKVTVMELDEVFSPQNEFTLLDTGDHPLCAFCGKPTLYYCTKEGLFVCANCYSKVCKKS